MPDTKSLPTYSTLYAFGDSLSDSGNDYILTTSQGKVTLPVSPPYHKEQYGLVAGTTFSNGPTWVQLLSLDLGLGILAPSLGEGRTSNAHNFAFGGAQTGSTQYNPEGTAERVLSLETQLSEFRAQVPAPAANALYTLSMGANDLIALLFNPNLTTSQRNSGVVQAVANEVGFISRLIGSGATHFVILNVPDLGDTPLGRDGAAHGGYTAADASALAAAYDSQLASQLAPLAASGVDIHILDGYSLIDAAVANPAAYGVTNARDPVWTGSFDNPNSGTLVSTDPAVQNQYLFFDLIHPTNTGHRAITDLAEASLTAGPVNPFAAVTVSDTAASAIQTVTVRLVPVTAGAFSNVGNGSFDAAKGIYTTTGTAAAVTADLQGVQFLPSLATAKFAFDMTLTGSGTARLLDTSSGTNVLRLGSSGGTAAAGSGSDKVYGGAGASTLLGGAGSGTFYAQGSSSLVVGAGPRDTVNAGAGTATVFAAASGRTLVELGTGAAVAVGGGADTVLGGGGTMLTSLVAGGLAFTGSGAATTFASQGSTVVGGSGSNLVAVRDTGAMVFGGTGPTTFIGGTGSSTVVGGVGGNGSLFAGQGGGLLAGGSGGNNILVGGQGATTLFGGGGGDILFAAGAAGTVLVAGSGNETLQGSASSGNDTFFIGSGNAVIGLGAGNDTVFAGAGNATMVGGSGANTLAFVNGRAGGTEAIIGFKPGKDRLFLQGYAPNEAARAFATATATLGGNGAPATTTITLSDSTRITFQGIAGFSATPFA